MCASILEYGSGWSACGDIRIIWIPRYRPSLLRRSQLIFSISSFPFPLLFTLVVHNILAQNYVHTQKWDTSVGFQSLLSCTIMIYDNIKSIKNTFVLWFLYKICFINQTNWPRTLLFTNKYYNRLHELCYIMIIIVNMYTMAWRRSLKAYQHDKRRALQSFNNCPLTTICLRQMCLW